MEKWIILSFVALVSSVAMIAFSAGFLLGAFL